MVNSINVCAQFAGNLPDRYSYVSTKLFDQTLWEFPYKDDASNDLSLCIKHGGAYISPSVTSGPLGFFPNR